MGQDGKWSIPPMGLETRMGVMLLLGLLAGCAGNGNKDSAPTNPPDLSNIPDAVPKVEPKSKYGNPASYVVFGKRYYTKKSNKNHVERGLASWYGRKFHGRRTSSGERYDMYAMTAAHKSLPLPTYARVTNVENGRTAVVKINDRGPFHGNRIIDLSYSAAHKLGVVARGTAMVEVKTIDPSRPESDSGGLFLASRDSASEPQNSFFDADDSTFESKKPGSKRVAVAQKTPPRTKPASPAEETRVRVAKTEKPDVRGKTAPSPMAETPAPEPKVAVATSEEKPRPAVGSSMYLQVGAFGSRLNAEQLRRRLVIHIAEQVQVRTIDGQASPWYKVHVGPLDSRKSAKDLSQRLASMGLAESHIVVE